MFEICQFELKTFSSEARCDVGTAQVSQLRYHVIRDRRQTRDKYLMIIPQTPTLFYKPLYNNIEIFYTYKVYIFC